MYRKDIKDEENFMYLYSTKEIDNIFYIQNYVYFITENTAKVYHDSFGVRPLVKYNEMEFNKNLHFHIYAR